MTDAVLTRLQRPAPLSGEEAKQVIDRLTTEATSDAERGAILMALELRGVSSQELAEIATAVLGRAIPFPIDPSDGAIDVCGSGGAPRPSFNVSTVSAIVVSAAGAMVVKHGNRSARRPTGSSDLLEALGLPIATSRQFSLESYRRYGLAFLHAPLYHPAMRAVAAARRALGIPTVFNRLGPLTNPARVSAQLTGVPDPASARLMSGALRSLGVRRGMVVYSADGRDEFAAAGRTSIVRWDSSGVRNGEVDGRERLAAADRVGDCAALPPAEAAAEAERILAGGGGSTRGSVLLTSGAALWTAGRARDLTRGVELAEEALDSGAAEEQLARLRHLAAEHPWTEAT